MRDTGHAFSQFHDTWMDRGFVMAPPAGSQDRQSTPDGHKGHNGADGTPGDNDTAPGPGHDGADGKNSHNLLNTGDALVFHKTNPLGQWSLGAQTGLGGDGGRGGDAGTFDSNADTGPWPDGGHGGDGGDSGRATARLDGHTIWGHRGSDVDDGLFLGVDARTGAGGDGGRGGQADGETGPVAEPGGDGGDGRAGGNGGNALVEITNNAFKTVGTHGDFRAYVSVVTVGGIGGDGALGGDGGDGGSAGDGTNGAGGAGGHGGNSTILFKNNTFDLTGAAGTTSTLYLDFLAYSGNGGNGSHAIGNPFDQSAPGGVAGDCSITMRNVDITGGAENDVVGINLECLVGYDGTAGDGTFDNHIGSHTYVVRDVNVDGGGGTNTLGFAISVNQSGFAVNVNLVKGTFFVDGTKGGTLTHIQNVVGAGGDDVLRGDGSANVLTGGSGNDYLLGGHGADTFFYNTHYESWGFGWDTLGDINFNEDRISLPFEVKHIDDKVTGAVLHSNTFISDMTTALGGHLNVGHAVLVDAEYHDGALTEQRTFLVVDGDGIAGYTYEDMVIDVTGHNGSLKVASFIEHAG